MTSKQPSSNSRFAPYKYALDALAARTRTPLPSLILSFAILHELTAMIPLVGLFFSARALGIGERFIEAVGVPVGVGHKTDSDNPVLPSGLSSAFSGSWLGAKSREWVHEGEEWAGRIGRRYGVFGFEKCRKSDRSDNDGEETHPDASLSVSGRIAGDVANAVVAYALTKALLPVRIGFSLYLAPGFSRRLVEPIGVTIARIIRRKPPTSGL